MFSQQTGSEGGRSWCKKKIRFSFKSFRAAISAVCLSMLFCASIYAGGIIGTSQQIGSTLGGMPGGNLAGDAIFIEIGG